jgi:peptidoglycan/LPS O-acetylase OafA/YrhL
LAIPYGLEPTWSLAIEEQFYLTWFLLVLLLKKRSLAIILVCASLFSLTLRVFGFEHGASLKFDVRDDDAATVNLTTIVLKQTGSN